MSKRLQLSAGHALVGVAIVVALLAFIALVVTLGSGSSAVSEDAAAVSGTKPTATAQPSAAPEEAGVEETAEPRPDPTAGLVAGLGPAAPEFPELAPSPEGKAERVPGTELEVSIGEVEAITAEAQGLGEVAGPAVRAVVTVRNVGTAAMDTAPFLIQGSIGQDRQPAMPLTVGAEPFPASIAPGKEGRAIVVFLRPESTPGPMLIGVGTVVGAPLATLVVE